MTTSLSTALEQRAATAPDAGPVLAAVHAGIHRRRRIRTTAVTAGSALAVGGLICAVVLIPRQGAAPTAAPADQPSTAASAVQSGLQTIAPAPSAASLSLTRVPVGFGYLGQAAEDVGAWGPTGTPLAGGFSDKLVVFTAVPESAPATFTAAAAGLPAAVDTGGSAVRVVLEATDDVRIVVQFPVGFEISADDALQVADSLDVREVTGGGVG